MSLLDRIAHSDGDPQRTIAALRLIHERQGYSPAKTEVGQMGTTTVAQGGSLAPLPTAESHRERITLSGEKTNVAGLSHDTR